VFLQGVFEKRGVFGVVFCGEVVVNYVVKRGALMDTFWRLTICHFLQFYFAYFLNFILREAMG
jgi:hypothetical protein